MEVKEFVSGGKKTEDSKKNRKKKINSAKKNYAKKNSQFTIAELKENSALIMLCVFVVFAVLICEKPPEPDPFDEKTVLSCDDPNPQFTKTYRKLVPEGVYPIPWPDCSGTIDASSADRLSETLGSSSWMFYGHDRSGPMNFRSTGIYQTERGNGRWFAAADGHFRLVSDDQSFDQEFIMDADGQRFRQRLEPDGFMITSGERICSQPGAGLEERTEAVKKLITRYYREFLGREPDVEGLEYWVGQYHGGVSLDSIKWGFCFSDEYRSKKI